VQVFGRHGEEPGCSDEGPLTLERSKTVDEEISAKVIDFLDRNDPRRTNKPFFVWYNPARMHVTTVLSDKYMAMVGEPGGKDWGVNEAGMKQMDDNIGLVLKSSKTWDRPTIPSWSSPPTTVPRRSHSRTAVLRRSRSEG
jgi:arylsulfatase A-like enzyme